MKTHFKDPIAKKKVTPKESPKDGKNTPWEQPIPEYDQRSSCFVNVGQHYGVGHRQPVGHEGNPKSVVDVLPKTRHPTMEVDEVL